MTDTFILLHCFLVCQAICGEVRLSSISGNESAWLSRAAARKEACEYPERLNIYSELDR